MRHLMTAFAAFMLFLAGMTLMMGVHGSIADGFAHAQTYAQMAIAFAILARR